MLTRRGGIRGLARALKQGALGLQAVDQNQRLRGVYVPFFGKLASTERAAATLAVRQGYPVAISSCVRIGKGFRFRIQLHEVIQVTVPANKEDVAAHVIQLVLRINQRLEKAILTYPEQYLWIHDRYRTQPETNPELPIQPLPSASDPSSSDDGAGDAAPKLGRLDLDSEAV